MFDRNRIEETGTMRTLADDQLFNGISEIVDDEDPKMSQTAEHSI